MGGEKCVREQCRCALVHRGCRHLHCGRRADLRADHDALDSGQRKRGDVGRAFAREVDARRPRLPGRRPGDRPVHVVASAPRITSASRRLVSGAMAFRSTTSGCADAAEARAAMSSATRSAASGGTIERTTSAVATTESRSGSNSIGALLARRTRARAPSRHGRDDPGAAPRERVRDRASHRTRADDPDGLHARRVYEHAATSDARSASDPCLTNVRSVPWEPASSPAKEEVRGAVRAHVAGRSRPARLR